LIYHEQADVLAWDLGEQPLPGFMATEMELIQFGVDVDRLGRNLDGALNHGTLPQSLAQRMRPKRSTVTFRPLSVFALATSFSASPLRRASAWSTK
jgi:hypothetical protein